VWWVWSFLQSGYPDGIYRRCGILGCGIQIGQKICQLRIKVDKSAYRNRAASVEMCDARMLNREMEVGGPPSQKGFGGQAKKKFSRI